jgi:hypothetical protein
VRTGDRVDVTLDCVTEQRAGRHVARVFVRHVDAPASEGGTRAPAEFPGARRNVVQGWLGVGRDQTLVAAYAIDCGPAVDGDLYFCPSSGDVESPRHGGFDTCCGRPDLHRTVAEMMRQAAGNLRSEYLCNWDTRVATALADLLDDQESPSHPLVVALAAALTSSFGGA